MWPEYWPSVVEKNSFFGKKKIYNRIARLVQDTILHKLLKNIVVERGYHKTHELHEHHRTHELKTSVVSRSGKHWKKSLNKQFAVLTAASQPESCLPALLLQHSSLESDWGERYWATACWRGKRRRERENFGVSVRVENQLIIIK